MVVEDKSLKNRKTLLKWSWIPCCIAVIVAIIAPFIMPGNGPIPAFIVLAVFAVMYGNGRYGWKNMLWFLGIYFVISLFMENMSTMIGFPFGLYSYSITLGTRIINVPFGVGLFYFDIGFLSWSIASILLDGADRKLNRKINVIAMPIVAAFVMTVIDLATDFTSATVQGLWIWPNGGGLYGVPYTNFLGWTFVTWLCAQIFALLLAKQEKKQALVIPKVSKKNFVWQTLAYGSLGLNIMIAFFAPGAAGTITDGGGMTWSILGMREGAFLIAFYTIIFIALLALFKLKRNDFNELAENDG